MKLWLQAFAGFVTAFGTFWVGAILTGLLPGASSRYLIPRDQLIVAALIFTTTLGLAIAARFARCALFLILGLVTILEVVVLVFIFGRNNWWGALGEIWNHTLLPVALSAIAVVMIKALRNKRSARQTGAANGRQAHRNSP